jgi:hypothetical protein
MPLFCLVDFITFCTFVAKLTASTLYHSMAMKTSIIQIGSSQGGDSSVGCLRRLKLNMEIYAVKATLQEMFA